MPSMVVCPECHSPILFGEHGKTVTRSFRIDETALAALEDEASRRNVSVNTFLNQQILSFAKFERFFQKLGLVKFSANTLQRLLDAASEESIADAAVAAALDTPRSIILSKSGQITFETTLEYIKTLSEFANLFEYSLSDSVDGKIITIFHRFGQKGSIFFAKYITTIFEQIDYSPRIKTGEHSVEFEILPRKHD